MTSSESIQQDITQHMTTEHVQVIGDDGVHFEALIVSAEFEGKNRIQRHQLVYKALGERMREEIHALSMKTLTPGEWQQQCKN